MAKVAVGIIAGHQPHPKFSPPERSDEVIAVIHAAANTEGFISSPKDNVELARAYNSIVSFVLTNYAEATHILFMHTNLFSSPNLLSRLLSINETNVEGKNVVGALTFQQLPPHFPQAFVRESIDTYRILIDWGDTNAPIEVDAISMAYTLIPIEVFKGYEYPWFDGTQKSSCDLWMCLQAQLLGYRIIVDTASPCKGYYMGKEVTIDCFKRYQKAEIESSRRCNIEVPSDDNLKRLPSR